MKKIILVIIMGIILLIPLKSFAGLTANFGWCKPELGDPAAVYVACFESLINNIDTQVSGEGTTLADHLGNLNYPHVDTTLPPGVTGITTSTEMEGSGADFANSNSQSGSAAISVSYDATAIPDFKEYIIRIKRDITIEGFNFPTSYTTFYTTETTFNFTGLIPGETYTINVAVIDNSGNQSNWSGDLIQVAATDLIAPNPITNLRATAGFKSVLIQFDANTDVDIAGYEVHISDTIITYIPDATTLISSGLSNIVTFNGTGATTYFVKVRSYDWSGNFSSYVGIGGVTTGLVATADIDNFAINASKIFTKIPIITGDAWSDNTPSAGVLAWNSHTLVYNGISFPISASNTAVIPTAKYIYWQLGASDYSLSRNLPSLGQEDFIIATNINGIHDLAWNALANQVIGSAFIADAAISNAKISDLSADKINTGILNANRIGALSINASKISIGLVNLVTNPYFETNIVDWGTIEGTGTIARTIVFASEGIYSLKILGGNYGAGNKKVFLKSGELYEISVNIKASSSTANGLFLRLNQRATNPASDFITDVLADVSFDFVTDGSTSSEWVTYTFNFIPGPFDVWASLAIVTGVGGPSSLYVDEVKINRSLTTIVADQLRTGTVGAEQIKLTDDKFVLNGADQTMIIKDEVGTERIKIGKLGSATTDYGMQIKNDAGVNIFNATGDISQAELTTGSINADLITTGSINADLITTGSINADLITTGTLTLSSGGTALDITSGGQFNVSNGTDIRFKADPAINGGTAYLQLFKDTGAWSAPHPLILHPVNYGASVEPDFYISDPNDPTGAFSDVIIDAQISTKITGGSVTLSNGTANIDISTTVSTSPSIHLNGKTKVNDLFIPDFTTLAGRPTCPGPGTAFPRLGAILYDTVTNQHIGCSAAGWQPFY